MDVSIFALSYYVSIIQRAINKLINISLFFTSINLTVILFSYGFFINQQSYHFLFIFNLIGSILVLLFNFFETRIFIKKIKYNIK